MFSHDFRTQLTVINFSAGLIKHYGTDMDVAHREVKLNEISSAVQQLNQMIEDMLMLVAMENSQYQYDPQPVDLIPLLEDIVNMFQRMHVDYVIGFHSDQPEQILLTDPKLVSQVVTNLLSNAIKYSPPESEIKLTLHDKAKAGIQLLVADQGVGIADEDLPELFTPFRRGQNTSHIPGTGLGMVIVKQAVDLCGGHISVQSEQQKGTTFIVTLPHQSASRV